MAESMRTIEIKKVEKVDLSGLFLDYFPSPKVNITLISKLDLSNNNLKSIPESLTARMINVLVFDVHSNQLKSLPNSIGCLTKLKVLNVSGNLLESLPKAIENCRVLQELNANFNKLTKLPEDIGLHLVNLQKISVNSNKLPFIPDTISNITSLRVLDARLNCLRALPADLENLINLEVLNISQNFHYLNALPFSVGLLMSLVELDASYNKIAALPDSIGCLRKLRKLSVEGNPLIYPPKDVVDHSLQAVKEYLCDRLNGIGQSSPTKYGSWLVKLTKYKSFNGRRDPNLLISNYQATDRLALPRYIRGFSPRHGSSPRSYFAG